ncbi:hypothetical protein DSO57_1013191 [Entomophthora muscae]|uniref:Uncharacterized protein n=1 Tax=Entomophthora muscae TaxID=34485 RepID=A0ACC2RKK1_9FUNG|nr:hypothetical protein DSO57_1013191 [Entomophthora muscae]
MGSRGVKFKFMTPYKALSDARPYLVPPRYLGYFGATPTSFTYQENLVAQLYNSGAIPEPIIHIGPFKGSVVQINFGEKDEQRLIGTQISYSLPHRRSSNSRKRTPFWGFSEVGIQVGTIHLGKLDSVALETKFNYTVVPLATKKLLMETLGSREFPCDDRKKLPQVRLLFKEYYLEIPPLAFTIEVSSGRCKVFFEDSGDEPIAYLPLDFFSENQVILDYEHQRITAGNFLQQAFAF